MANLAQQEQATDEEQRVIDKFNLSFNLCSVIPVINTFILDKCCFAAKADYDINNLADIQIALVLYIVLFYHQHTLGDVKYVYKLSVRDMYYKSLNITNSCNC